MMEHTLTTSLRAIAITLLLMSLSQCKGCDTDPKDWKLPPHSPTQRAV